MYRKVNNKISEVQLKVLSLFTRGFNREYYIREVQKMLKISPRTAQLALEFLEKRSILESTIRGKIKTYKIKKNFLAKDYLILAETYKRIIFLEKNLVIKDILEKITHSIEGIALIFGSYSKGNQKEDSDLDIFVVGYYNINKIKEISKLYGIKINVKNYPLNIFKKKYKEDILIKEGLNDHILIKGIEGFIEVVLQ